ncbi:hypothetical protein P3S68_007081 [Capsicum galapagoense]
MAGISGHWAFAFGLLEVTLSRSLCSFLQFPRSIRFTRRNQQRLSINSIRGCSL